jgi:hypothetical protein
VYKRQTPNCDCGNLKWINESLKKRVSVSYYFIKWDADPLVATDTKRTNLTPSHATTVVSPTPRFVYTMVVRRSHSGTNSPAASISSPRRRK